LSPNKKRPCTIVKITLKAASGQKYQQKTTFSVSCQDTIRNNFKNNFNISVQGLETDCSKILISLVIVITGEIPKTITEIYGQ